MAGTASTNFITLSTNVGDLFENGINTMVLSNTYDNVKLLAGPNNRWYTLGGTIMPAASIGTLRSGITQTGLLFPRMSVVAVTGTALTSSSSPALNTVQSGVHYNITNSGFNSFTCPSGLIEGFFYVLRNNTGGYLTCTQTGGLNPNISGIITIPPGTSVTLVFSTTTGNTNSWVIF